MILKQFPKLVKDSLKFLPKNDYPVLNTSLFVACWLGFVLDGSLNSMRDLFRRLKFQDYPLDISTFSKASKSRDPAPFLEIYYQLQRKIKPKFINKNWEIFPIDSTSITLTSKLLWNQGYHQVKLFSGLNIERGLLCGEQINFGNAHDQNFGKSLLESLPENGVAIMDRGFASHEFLQSASSSSKYFLVRISQNFKLNFEEGKDQVCVGAGKNARLYRVISFCDRETQTEYRLVTNLPKLEERGFTNEEVADLYRQRWQIELLWKFLKMHLKLDRLITKSCNGIRIQIYATLIVYLLLQLMEMPKEFGKTLLDKLRFLQANMCQHISGVHWIEKLVRC